MQQASKELSTLKLTSWYSGYTLAKWQAFKTLQRGTIMGMDLITIEPMQDAPKDKNGRTIDGRYNITGWTLLWNLLIDWKVDTSEFSGYNDGEQICKETCLAVAKAIEDNLHTLNKKDKDWLQPHIILWKTCGGYEQW